MKNENINLSVCVATKEREIYINNFIKIITSLICNKTEIVVVDGSKSYNSSLAKIVSNNSNVILKYIHNKNDTGLDKAYDDAVKHSSGKYCWLATDDDLPDSNIFEYIQDNLESKKDLYILNTRTMCSNLDRVFEKNRLKIYKDLNFIHLPGFKFDNKLLWQLSFIGCMVILRDHWVKTNVSNYHGCYFSHIASIFKTSERIKIKVLHKPIISIRVNNETWRSNHLKLWHYYWPRITSMIELGFKDIDSKCIIDDIPFRVLIKYYILNKLENKKMFDLNPRLALKIKILELFPKKIVRFFGLMYSVMKKNQKLKYIIKEISLNEKT